MKKTSKSLKCILLFISLGICAHHANAQLFSIFGLELSFSPHFNIYLQSPMACAHPDGLHISIQPQMGVHRLSYTSDGASPFMNSRWGEHYGAQLTIAADAPVVFETGILLMKTNVAVGKLEKITWGFTEVNTKTMKVPFAFGYRMGRGEKVYFRLNAGATLNAILDVDPRSGQSRLDYRPVYWSLRGGVGMDIFFFTLDLNGELGISQIFEADTAPRSRLLMMSLGLRI